MRLKRRQFIRAALVGGGGAGLVNVFRQPRVAAAPPLPEVEAFKKTQQRLLAKYNVSARSRYLKLTKPALTTHVLEAGDGKPLLMLHGGGLFACQFAPLIGGLQKQFRVFAVDRPGCGLTDTFHYGGVALRQHAIDFVNGVLDALNLPEVALAGASMGGLWALMFALAKPERVTKLALLGEPAWSAAEPHPPAPATKPPTIESVREGYRARSVANIARVPDELLEAALAARRLPGASESWNKFAGALPEREDGNVPSSPGTQEPSSAHAFYLGRAGYLRLPGPWRGDERHCAPCSLRTRSRRRSSHLVGPTGEVRRADAQVLEVVTLKMWFTPTL